MKYEVIPTSCQECGTDDDSIVGDSGTAIEFRVDGRYICTNCAASRYHIKEALDRLIDMAPVE